ncbi:MAG: hypothetical protein H0V49_11065 [Nocardioidaceae bacterium]|nr:hypothetical protein [Nocardioidaceae bacterium]
MLIAPGAQQLSTGVQQSDVDIYSDSPARVVTKGSIGYVAYWDQLRAVRSIKGAGAAITEVSPSWYTLASDGTIVVQEPGEVDDSPGARANSVQAGR